jgi:uncharacterized SAM-binding protein YcdF (DUF218 family)
MYQASHGVCNRSDSVIFQGNCHAGAPGLFTPAMPALLGFIEFITDARTLGFLALILGVLLLWTRRDFLGRAILTFTVAFALIVGVLPLGAWLLGTLENRFPAATELPAQVHGIVVIAGDFDVTLATSRGRYSAGDMALPRFTAMGDLARRFPEARIVLAGVTGPATSGEEFAASLGIAPARLIIEDRSRNTYETAMFSLRSAAPATGETWMLITSAFHMPRAIGSFRRAGWMVTPFPVDYWTGPATNLHRPFGFDSGLRLLAQALREYGVLFTYATFGLTDSWLPGPAR